MGYKEKSRRLRVEGHAREHITEEGHTRERITEESCSVPHEILGMEHRIAVLLSLA